MAEAPSLEYLKLMEQKAQLEESKIRDYLKEYNISIENNKIVHSITDYGVSHYFNVKNESGEITKVRISDHQATNTVRQANEFMINELTPKKFENLEYFVNPSRFRLSKIEGRPPRVGDVNIKGVFYEKVKITATIDDVMSYAEKKQAFIEKSLSSLDANINKLQQRLFNELSDKLLSKMVTENGKLIQNVSNFQAVNSLEQLMREFSQQFVTPVIRSLADDMLKTIALTDEAFKDGYNVSDAQMKAMQEQSKWVLTSIGIRPNGDIIAGGYLSKLAEMPEVQTKIREYISSNLINSAGLSEFQKGFKTLIEGTKDLPGEIAKYHQQFSYDLFNQADSAVTKVYAEEQGFKYFLYFGSIIDSSRCFCRKRAGKVFSYEDTKKWQDDPTLINYYKDHPYDPIIMRGGFNCRHSIEPISDEMAKRMGYNKADAQAIVDEECD